MKNTNMRVVMGSSAIKAFVAAPKSLKIIGVVRLGLEFGLLGQDADGHYLRVNGSQIESLSRKEVLAAIAFAHEVGRTPKSQELTPENPVISAPVVAIRKRRHALVPPVTNPARLAA